MDKHRVNLGWVSSRFTACLMAVILVLLSVYSFLRPGTLELSRPQPSVGDRVGREVQLTHNTRVVELLPDGFVVGQLGTTVQIVGDNTGLMVGDVINLRGVWQADGTIRVEAYDITRQRHWRMLASVPPALVGAWIFLRTFRWDSNQRTFVTRHYA